jgi:hypothetical protein
MAIQKRRIDRIKKNWKTPFDYYNNHSDRNHNPKNHQCITTEVMNFYFPCRKFDCKLNYEQKVLGLDIPPPKCFYETGCNKRLRIHGCYSGTKKDNGKLSYPIVETLTQGLYRFSQIIYISRPNAVWLYQYKVPIIFRTSWDNGFVLHHLNEMPLYDFPEALAVIDSKLHTRITNQVTQIRNKMNKIKLLMYEDPSHMGYKRLLQEQTDEIKKISNVQTDSRVWALIDELYKKASNLTEV